MDKIQKQLCLSTILTLVMASGAVAIGFTSFVQAEIKEDLDIMRSQELIDREKITNLQITNAEINGKLTLILEKLQAEPQNYCLNWAQIDQLSTQIPTLFHTNMGFKETFHKGKDTSREIARKITDGVIPNSHIGNHTIESLSQEVFSLRNVKPMFRDSRWKKQFLRTESSVLDKIAHGQNQFQSLIHELNQVREMR